MLAGIFEIGDFVWARAPQPPSPARDLLGYHAPRCTLEFKQLQADFPNGVRLRYAKRVKEWAGHVTPVGSIVRVALALCMKIAACAYALKELLK